MPLSLLVFAEQQTNARYACVEWGVGVEVGDEVRRETVEERIREVMGGEELRRRADEWKEIGDGAAARSMANLDSLIKDVLLAAPATAPAPQASSSMANLGSLLKDVLLTVPAPAPAQQAGQPTSV